MYKTSSKQDIEDKWEDRSNVSKTILKQLMEGSLGYSANGPIGVSSTMSKTSLKQRIEDKSGGLSNVSKTIVKQVIEAEFWDIAPIVQ